MLYIHLLISHCWYTKAHQLSHCHTHTLSLSHVTHKNNLVTNLKCLILHINYSLHKKWVLLNRISTAEDTTSHSVALPHDITQHNTTQHTQCTLHNVSNLLHTNTPTQNPTQFPVRSTFETTLLELLNCAILCSLTTATGNQAVYQQATKNSHREWQYHMLHVYNCILLKMSTWGSKHVEENIIIILWINNNWCIKLVINI